MRRPPPILTALVVAGAAALLLARPIEGALAGLKAARAARDAAASLVAAPPPPPVPGDRAIAAGSQARASDALAARLRALAGHGAILVETLVPVAGDGAARVRLRVSGSQDGVVAFADAVERDAHVMRFAGWTLTGEGAAVRLSGQVVAPWR